MLLISTLRIILIKFAKSQCESIVFECIPRKCLFNQILLDPSWWLRVWEFFFYFEQTKQTERKFLIKSKLSSVFIEFLCQHHLIWLLAFLSAYDWKSIYIMLLLHSNFKWLLVAKWIMHSSNELNKHGTTFAFIKFFFGGIWRGMAWHQQVLSAGSFNALPDTHRPSECVSVVNDSCLLPKLS